MMELCPDITLIIVIIEDLLTSKPVQLTDYFSVIPDR